MIFGGPPDFDLFPGMMMGQNARQFSARYKCYSIAMYEQSHASDEKVAEMENGGKILLPQSALDYLTRLHIEYPMMFKITNVNPSNQRVTHAGVIEFHHEEGKCFLPYWMMRNLLLNEEDLAQIDYASLPTATYMKLQPQSADFLDITNPRAVLELKLRSFSCLTKSDVIAINYNNKIYEFLVEELKPANAVSIIECDMNVEFSPPIGYKEPQKINAPAETKTEPVHEPTVEQASFVAFGGKGYRSDGKEKGATTGGSSIGSGNMLNNVPGTSRLINHVIPKVDVKRGIPNYDYKPGKLTFVHMPVPKITPVNGASKETKMDRFSAFGGQGQSLKGKKPA